MDYSDWGFWLAAAQAAGALIVTVVGALLLRMRRSESRTERVEKTLDLRVDHVEQRVAKVETSIEHGVTGADLGRIHKRIDEVGAAIARIEGAERAQRSQLDLIHQHLLDRHGK